MRQKIATERELFAIFTMVRHFKHYLVTKQFIVRMDHQALTQLRTMKEIDHSVACWYEDLQQHDFVLQYRKRTTHSNVDALSRRPLSAEGASGVVSMLFLSEPTGHQWRNTQSTDPDAALVYERFLASSHKPTAEEMNSSSKAAKRIWRQWSKLILEDEVLWYQEDATSPKRLAVPGSLIQTVFQELHEQLEHIGEKKMVEASSERYWWSSLTPDVLDFCRTCIPCSRFKRPHSTAIAPLQPMPTGFPGGRVGIDTMGPLPLTKRGNRYILVMVDYFTKVVEAEAMKS
ncbi:Transposon Ty3-I Gag-Pol polyprotein [Taenia solium]|eukprot:TsM_000039000 transcript=TsM_000039000 gene=TsM_000039000